MAQKSQPSNGKWVVLAIVAAIATALLVAVVVGGGDEGSDTTNSLPGGDVLTQENQPVVIEGTVLESLGDEAIDPMLGQVAPTLNGATFDGSGVSVTPGDGQAYMIVFLAHWCPHCNREVPRLIEWQASGAVPSELQVVGVSTAVASDRPNYPPSQWVVEKGWTWPILADSSSREAAEAYGVSGFPFFVIVGADGTVKARVSGEVEIPALTQIVSDALAD
ncbi:MAG: TlpA family protein disulfide reductase [Ilumatobacteraceae bacterium]|nr:TlpA family protein disulfide reductase [Ilumatobacteraceae bacterium]